MIYKFEASELDSGGGYGRAMRFTYRQSDGWLSQIDSKHVPGCCGVSVLYNINKNSICSKKIFNNFIDRIINFYETEEQYGKLLTYVLTGSKEEVYFKANDSVKELYTFVNPRSGNKLTALEIDLDVEVEEEEEDIF